MFSRCVNEGFVHGLTRREARQVEQCGGPNKLDAEAILGVMRESVNSIYCQIENTVFPMRVCNPGCSPSQFMPNLIHPTRPGDICQTRAPLSQTRRELRRPVQAHNVAQCISPKSGECALFR